MAKKATTGTAKVSAPMGTLPQDEHADNPGEQAEWTDEAAKLAQERVDASEHGTLPADRKGAA